MVRTTYPKQGFFMREYLSENDDVSKFKETLF